MTSEALIVRSSTELEGARLGDLAARVRSEHVLVGKSLERSLVHAIAVGHALLEAKKLFGPRGGFEIWREEECGIVASLGTFYMRLAYYEDVLPDGINQHEAGQFIRGLPAVDGRPIRAPYPEVVREEAKRRRKTGESYHAISKALHIPVTTIYRWCEGKRWGRGAAERAQKRRALERAARREAKRHEAEKAARLRGGSISKSYSLLRQLAQELDAAISQSEDHAVRRELKASLVAVHSSEVHLYSALGVDYGSWRSG